MREVTPLGALARGLAAGAAGAGAQSAFFAATGKWMPQSPKGVFQPPDEQQASENGLQTVVRRTVEGLLRRGPLTARARDTGVEVLHYAYGAAWGGLWGLARESFPGVASAAGVAAFSNLVWLLGDELMYPAFRLGAWPHHYPAKTHAYSNLAHVAFGAGVCFAYEALRQPIWAFLGTALWALAARRKVHQRLPKATWPAADRLVAARVWLRTQHPLSRARAFAGV
ncbi:MAG: hypothetical protein QM765_06650 [Myxococcales bacterium]